MTEHYSVTDHVKGFGDKNQRSKTKNGRALRVNKYMGGRLEGAGSRRPR